MKLQKLAVVSLVIMSAVHMHAQIIIRPTAVSSIYLNNGNNNEYFSAGFMIDNSGLTTALNTGDVVPATSTTVTSGGDNSWVSGVDGLLNGGTVPNTRLTFDLGGSFNVGSMLMWGATEIGWNPTLLRTMQTANIFSSTDGTNYTSVGVATFALDTQTPSMQTYIFPSSITANFIRVEPTTNFGDANYFGANEIRFATGTAIPEPGTFAALVGLVGLGFAAARRRAKR
jgi:hypothetical protein